MKINRTESTHEESLINSTIRRSFLAVCAIATVFLVLLAQPAHAGVIKVPRVPANIAVDAAFKPYLVGHAIGTQNYICLPTGWTLYGPQANLYSDSGKLIITHFLSLNPLETNTPRATWQYRDASAVWAKMIETSSDSTYVAEGAIPWLKLQVVGAQENTTGGKITTTMFIQRLNTQGGIAPATGCADPTDVGKKSLVPYTADYFFYREAHNEK